MKNIKFGEVKINSTTREHILDCCDRNYVTMGPKTALLEEKWSELFGFKNTVAVSSGTSACMAANMWLYDCGAKPGDEVIVPALSFIATANAVRTAGFTPVFCDVKDDLLIDETKIESLITDKTRAIMPVALMGKPPKMDVIVGIAEKYNLKVILDNCEGHGCKYMGRFMEFWADVVVYSCYAAHILFSGEMGFVCTNRDDLADSIRSIRSHGRKPGTLYFDHVRYGLNLKPTDLHACIGLGNVGDFWNIFATRKRNWTYIKEHLVKYVSDYFWMSDETWWSITSPHGFSFTARPNTKATCKGLEKAFDDAGIEWKRNFGCMATQHECFSYLGHKLGEFPIAEYIGDNGIHIGVHNYLTDEDLDLIVKTVRSYIDSL